MRITINIYLNLRWLRKLMRPGVLVPFIMLIGISGSLYLWHRSNGPGSVAAAATTATADAGGAQTALKAASLTAAHTRGSRAPEKTRETQLIADSDCASANWDLQSPAGMVGSDVSACPLPRFSQLRHLTVVKPPAVPWDAQLDHAIPTSILAGSHLRLSVWARSPDRLKIRAVCEQAQSPYLTLAWADYALTPQWRRYDLAWTADRSVRPGWAHVALELGDRVGHVDVAGATLTSSAVM